MYIYDKNEVLEYGFLYRKYRDEKRNIHSWEYLQEKWFSHLGALMNVNDSFAW